MTRGTRLLILVCLVIGVIVLMMDCAKKSMRKKHREEGEGSGESQSLYQSSPPGQPTPYAHAGPWPSPRPA